MKPKLDWLLSEHFCEWGKLLMTRVTAEQVVPLYAEQERRSRVARSTKVGYHRPKSRRKRYMNRRAPVRDSARSYRTAVMKATPYRDFGSMSMGKVYVGLATVRVGKTAIESAKESDDMLNLVDLADLVSAEPDKHSQGCFQAETEAAHDTADECNSEHTSINDNAEPAPTREVISLISSSDSEDEIGGESDLLENQTWRTLPDVIIQIDSSDDELASNRHAAGADNEEDACVHTGEDRSRSMHTFGEGAFNVTDKCDDRTGEYRDRNEDLSCEAITSDDQEDLRCTLPERSEANCESSDQSIKKTNVGGEEVPSAYSRVFDASDTVPWPLGVVKKFGTRRTPTRLSFPTWAPWIGAAVSSCAIVVSLA